MRNNKQLKPTKPIFSAVFSQACWFPPTGQKHKPRVDCPWALGCVCVCVCVLWDLLLHVRCVIPHLTQWSRDLSSRTSDHRSVNNWAKLPNVSASRDQRLQDSRQPSRQSRCDLCVSSTPALLTRTSQFSSGVAEGRPGFISCWWAV